MDRRLTEQPQATSPKSDTALIWVELRADLIVAEAMQEKSDAGDPRMQQP